MNTQASMEIDMRNLSDGERDVLTEGVKILVRLGYQISPPDALILTNEMRDNLIDDIKFK